MNRAICEQFLNQTAILPCHASMVDGETKGEKIPQVAILDIIGFFLEISQVTELGQTNCVIDGQVLDKLHSLHSLCTNTSVCFLPALRLEL